MGHLHRWHVCTLRDVSTFQKLIMGHQNSHACKTHHWTARPVGLQSLVHTLGIKTCHYLKRINAIVVIRTCLISYSCGGQVIWPQHHLSICLSVLGVCSAHFDQRCRHKVPLLIIPLLFFVHQEKKNALLWSLPNLSLMFIAVQMHKAKIQKNSRTWKPLKTHLVVKSCLIWTHSLANSDIAGHESLSRSLFSWQLWKFIVQRH